MMLELDDPDDNDDLETINNVITDGDSIGGVA